MDTIQTLREETNNRFAQLREENSTIIQQNSNLQERLSWLCSQMEGKTNFSVPVSQDGSPGSGDNSQAGGNGISSGGGSQ